MMWIRSHARLGALAAVLALGLILPAKMAPAHAGERGAQPVADGPGTSLGALELSAAWARPRLGKVPNSAAYMTIRNTGDSADRLVRAESTVAERTELHEHRMDEGVMRMRPIEGGIALPAGQSVALKPGGFHIMLLGLTGDLAAGDTFNLTLTFQTAGTITIPVSVRPLREGGHQMR